MANILVQLYGVKKYNNYMDFPSVVAAERPIIYFGLEAKVHLLMEFELDLHHLLLFSQKNEVLRPRKYYFQWQETMHEAIHITKSKVCAWDKILRPLTHFFSIEFKQIKKLHRKKK